jgi:hypothetical protein
MTTNFPVLRKRLGYYTLAIAVMIGRLRSWGKKREPWWELSSGETHRNISGKLFIEMPSANLARINISNSMEGLESIHPESYL